MTPSGTECLRCVHNPKAYSSLNNMDPGTVPHELFVSASTHLADMLYYPICKLASARQKCRSKKRVILTHAHYDDVRCVVNIYINIYR